MDLRAEEPTRERVLAAAFRMLDTGSPRVGSQQYAESNGSHGLATLLCSHATVRDGVVSLHFPVKSGQEWRSEIADADLASVVHSLQRRGSNARLLAWRQGAKWHPVIAQEINAHVRERTGGEFTAKDFRTLHGTVVAAVSFAKHGCEPRKSARDRAIAQAMRDTSSVLGNTPSIRDSSTAIRSTPRSIRAG